MGSAKVSVTKPTMEKQSFKPINLIKSLFHKDKKKEKGKEKKIADKPDQSKAPKESETTRTETKKPEQTIECILEPFKKLDIETNVIKDEEDELSNFTFKVIEDDRRSNRIDSQSSEDSGFADQVIDNLDKLTLHDKDERQDKDEEDEGHEDKDREDEKETKDKKKTRQVLVKRAPIRSKVSEFNAHPYMKEDLSINQINKQTLSGGQVTVNPSTPDTFSELDVALQSVAKIYHSDPAYWEDVLDVISSDSQVDVLSAFPQISEQTFHSIDIIPEKIQTPNPIEEFSELQNLPNYEESILNYDFGKNDSYIFPTPPRSENVPSPLSESQAFYASNSDYTLSPERSSPTYNSDFEKYQEISPLSFDEEEKELKRDTDNASQMSCSNMTMKNFKDLQKEIASEFSKKECCDINRKATKEIFEEYFQKLKAVERKNLCLKVSQLDLKTVYGVLHNILLSLSRGSEQEGLQYALFALLCQRVLAQNPALFVGDFGLSILKAAVLRCPHRPLLTRHIVHCVYLVLKSDPKLCANECVFHEVDAQGDNLVIACARGGDACALVLAEITRKDVRGDLPPLFRLDHTNSDGYTALHVSCREHSAASPRLHTVHVLLEHANADLLKGDIKGGDTALHLAVNSSTCCLRLVVTLFKHHDRSLWKKLAHNQNMSSVTPLEYARSAVKSTTRLNYPHEVLVFLKKCR